MATDTVKIVKEDFGPFLRLHVEGTVNESLTTDMLVGFADGRPVVIDLSKVTRITSFGVRQWIRALGNLREKVPMVFLDRCSYSSASQLNMIQGFAAKCVVVSVYAPMTCSSCNREEKILIDVRNGPPRTIEAKCVSCKSTTELDEDMGSFFHFAVAHHVDPANAIHVAWASQLVELRNGNASKTPAQGPIETKKETISASPVAQLAPVVQARASIPMPAPGPSFGEKKPLHAAAMPAPTANAQRQEPIRSTPVSLNIDADQMSEMANLVAAKVSASVSQILSKSEERRNTSSGIKAGFRSHNILPEIIAFLLGVAFAVAYFAIVR